MNEKLGTIVEVAIPELPRSVNCQHLSNSCKTRARIAPSCVSDGDGVHPEDDHTHAWPAALGRDGPDFLARREGNWQDSQNMYCCGVECESFTRSAQRGLHFRFGTRRPERRQLPMAFPSAGTTYRQTSKQMGLTTAAHGMQVDV